MFELDRLPAPDALGFFTHPDIPDEECSQDVMVQLLATRGWDAFYEELDDIYTSESAEELDPIKIRAWAPDTTGGYKAVSKFENEWGVFALLVRPRSNQSLAAV